MLTKPILMLSFIFVWFVGLAFAQNNDPLRCPKTTVYKRVKISAERSEKTNYFAQFEEFCTQRGASRRFVKHGPYRLWGPNGEVIIQGRFVNGKKNGTWTRWIPSQTVEELWENGKYISADTKEARPIQIDYEGCVRQSGSWDSLYISTTYEVLGAEGKYCKVRYSTRDTDSISFGELIDESKWTNCRVPRSKKKNALTASENDLYCEKPK